MVSAVHDEAEVEARGAFGVVDRGQNGDHAVAGSWAGFVAFDQGAHDRAIIQRDRSDGERRLAALAGMQVHPGRRQQPAGAGERAGRQLQAAALFTAVALQGKEDVAADAGSAEERGMVRLNLRPLGLVERRFQQRVHGFLPQKLIDQQANILSVHRQAESGSEEAVTALRAERRSQAERRDEAEQRMLAAAVRLVSERGLERITLAEVGEAAGYSRGLPAHYFGSKGGLIVMLARNLVEGFGRALGRSEHHPLGLQRLLGIVAFYFDSARKDPTGTR